MPASSAAIMSNTCNIVWWLQDQYTVPVKSEAEAVERIKSVKTETTSRIKDNQQTHLVFGYDHTLPLSEKVSLKHIAFHIKVHLCSLL